MNVEQCRMIEALPVELPFGEIETVETFISNSASWHICSIVVRWQKLLRNGNAEKMNLKAEKDSASNFKKGG